jgi:tetratricopeptide (TPR) repeat protein
MENLGKWLAEAQMEQYFTLFEENEITFDDLKDITSDDLKEIGITSLPHRKKIMAAIAALSQKADGLQPLQNLHHLPYPAAIRFMRLNDAIVSGASGWDVVSFYKDSVEALIKTFCVYGIGQYLACGDRCPENDTSLLKMLARPSTGVWVNILKKLLVINKQQPDPSARLYGLFFTDKKGKDCQGENMGFLQDFVQFRNEMHHAARMPDQEYVTQLKQQIPVLQALLDQSTFLGRFPILKGLEEGMALTLSGTKPEPVAWDFPPQLENKLFYANSGGAFVEVEPFFIYLRLEQGKDETLFLYDSQKSYGVKREAKLLYMIDYDRGQRIARYEPAQILESRFGEQLLQEVFNAFKATILSMGAHVKNFSAVLDRHSMITGRVYIRKHMESFMENHRCGYFMLTGEPGIGKTAIMANLINPSEKQAHYFFKAGSNYDNPDDCTNAIFHFLAHKYNIEASNQQVSPADRRLQLEDLLAQISAMLLPGQRETIVLDALDEAAKAQDGKTIGEILPPMLPPGIFFVVSARPNTPAADQLKANENCLEYVLDPESEDNQRDAMEYTRTILGNKATDAEAALIARKGHWNFLLIKLACEAIVRDGCPFHEVDDYFRAGKDLHEWYQGSYMRIEQKFSDDPDKLEKIRSILGAVAAAGNPVSKNQLCELLNMPQAWLDWALRFTGQFFDIIQISEMGVNKPGLNSDFFYRFFHTSFNHFVSQKLFTDLKEFHRLWASYYADWQDKTGFERDYAVQSLPRHLQLSGQNAPLVKLISEAAFLRELALTSRHFDLAPYWTSFDKEELDGLFEESLRSAEQDLEFKAAALLAAGDLHQHLGHFELAIWYFEQSVEAAQNANLTAARADATFSLAWCLRHTDQFEQSITHLKVAGQLYQQLQNQPGVARCWSITGINQWQLHQDMDALASLEKAIGLLTKTEAIRPLAEAHNHMGIIYRGLGQYDQALNHLHLTRQLLEKNNDLKGLGKAYNSLGTATWWSGFPEQSLQFYHKANEINQKLGQSYIMGLTFNNLGYVYLELGQLPDAVNAFETSRQIRRDTGVRSFELMDMSGLALAWHHMGEHEKALALSREALEGLQAFKTVEDLQRAWFNHYLIAGHFSEHTAEAAQSLEKAKKLVMARYEKIKGEAMRANYLAKINLNRSIMEHAEKMG